MPDLGQIGDWTPPTDTQLERFIEAMLMGEARRRGLSINAPWGARMAMRNPTLKQAWLDRHRGLQEAFADV